MNGSKHELDDELNDHPNGRCTRKPWLWGDEDGTIETGEEAFAKLTEADQDRILGPAGGWAYGVRQAKLGKFVGVRESAEWGKTIYVRSLTEIVGAKRAKQLAAEAAQWPSVYAQTVVRIQGLDLDALMGELYQVQTIGELSYHFKKHGKPLGVSSENEYVKRMLAHIAKPDLQFRIQWAKSTDAKLFAIDEAESEVLMYDILQHRTHSYFWSRDPTSLLLTRRLIDIALVEGVWVIK